KAIEVAGVVSSEGESASLSFPFKAFGRPNRSAQVQCDCQRDPNPTIVQTLYLANHPKVRDKITAKDGRVTQILKEFADHDRRIEELFRWTVSRLPTQAERSSCLTYLKTSPTPKQGLEDVLWSLLNTREFILNH